MPYYHSHCGGEIKWYPLLPIPPRCTKCRKKWSPLVLYGLPPRDMVYLVPESKIRIAKGKTSYAKWGDRIPFVDLLASRLPNWPRKFRILTLVGFVILLTFLFYWVLGR